jgi:hypothetical protein
MNLQDRFDRLDLAVANNAVARGTWTACLLSQLAPECESAESWTACPSEVMPPWLAALTPWMADSASPGAWPNVVRRYAALSRRWHVLTPDSWRRLMHTANAISVWEAMRQTEDDRALAACRTVRSLCERAAIGDDLPTVTEWQTAARAARAAGRAAWATAAAGAAAVDRITAAILGSIKDACTKAEAT